MAASTLIVGLGGMGWKIVKMVADMTSADQRKNIKFVVIDTDANELTALKNSRYPGRIIQTSARMTVKGYLHNDEYARDHWFPVHPLLDNKVVTEGASQVRAISRLAFNTTVRSGGMSPLHDAIDELYRLTGKELDQALRIIVVSSLAGGTGSGILLPVGMYIRNYLLTKYHQSAAIIQGFFILPEVFYQEIDNEAQRDNLRCNAYAALRELDAFLMRADNTLPDRYRGLTLEFPRPGKYDWEDYSVLPYDNCFLFDGQNINGAKLNSFQTYMEHAANCIYAQSISAIAERSNSAQDNTFRPLVAAKGRNRYCGAGSAILRYPYEDIREYIALRWIQNSMSEHWLDADHILEDKKRQHQRKLDEGFAESDFDETSEYITAVETSGNSFAKAIVSWCEFRDPENPAEVEGSLWESYLSELLHYVEEQLSERQPSLDEMFRSRVSPAIVQGTVEIDLNNPDTVTDEAAYLQRVNGLLKNLRTYQEETARTTIPAAEAIAYSILHSSKGPIREKHTPYLVESFLKRNNQAIPPNAMRYALCKISRLIQEQIHFEESKVRHSENVWKNFEKAFDDHDQEKSRSAEETIRQLTVRRRALFGRKWQINDEIQELLSSRFTEYSQATADYRRYKSAEIVLKAVGEYVDSLIEAFSIFYGALEGQLAGLEERQQMLLASHENDIGYARRLVCCSPACMEALYNAVPNVGGLSNLPPELSTLIYERVRDYALQTQQQRRTILPSRQQAADNLRFEELFPQEKHASSSYFIKTFNELIMGYWKHLVSMRADSLINMDIIDALEKEGELEHGCISAADKRAYAAQVMEETQRLAAPFIESSYNPDVWTINGCTYSDQLAEKDYEHRRPLLDRCLKGAVTEQAGVEQIDRYQIVFYQSVYCIRAMELPKFSAPVPAMGNENGGDYYRAYFELTRQISCDPQQTLVISPHLNRYWHLPNYLPDLDENNMKRQEQEVMRAFFYGLVSGIFSYDKLSRANEERRYAFHLKNPETGDYFPEDLPNPDSRPCTLLYEVYDALLLNPPVVNAVNREYRRLLTQETGENLPFRQGAFCRKLEDFCLPEIRDRYGIERLGILDFILIYRLNLPKTSYEEPQFVLLTETLLQLVLENIRAHSEQADVALEFTAFFKGQLPLFFANLERLAENVPGIRDDSLLRVFRNALMEILESLDRAAEAMDIAALFDPLLI